MLRAHFNAQWPLGLSTIAINKHCVACWCWLFPPKQQLAWVESAPGGRWIARWAGRHRVSGQKKGGDFTGVCAPKYRSSHGVALVTPGHRQSPNQMASTATQLRMWWATYHMHDFEGAMNGAESECLLLVKAELTMPCKQWQSALQEVWGGGQGHTLTLNPRHPHTPFLGRYP